MPHVTVYMCLAVGLLQLEKGIDEAKPNVKKSLGKYIVYKRKYRKL